MAIRLYEGRMEFDYDSSDGNVKTTHTVYIESDGLYFDGTIYGTGSPGVIISSPVSSDSSGLATGDFEFQPNQIAFGTNTLFAKADGSGVVFSGTIGATLNSVEKVINPLGTVAGFTSGGYTTTRVDDIEKFPFAISTGTSTNVGNLTSARDQSRGASSATDGFAVGTTPTPFVNYIDKFPFAISSGTSSSHGRLSYTRFEGAVNPSPSYGFYSAGFDQTFAITSDIQKFPYSSAVTANSVGSLVADKARQSDHESTVVAFIAGGLGAANYVSDIERFPFSISSGTATNIGNLTETKGWNSGVSSETDGFSIGGYPQISTIEKFPFSISGGTATDVGDLTGTGLEGTSAQSSTTDGFTAGGGFAAGVTIIQKFPFAISSGTAADTGGDLNQGIAFGAGYQD